MLYSGPSKVKTTCLPGMSGASGRSLVNWDGKTRSTPAVGGLLQRDLVPQQFLDGGDQEQLLLSAVGNAFALRQPEAALERLFLRE